jgi:hypothetical protein
LSSGPMELINSKVWKYTKSLWRTILLYSSGSECNFDVFWRHHPLPTLTAYWNWSFKRLTRSFLASPSIISTIWVTVWHAYKFKWNFETMKGRNCTPANANHYSKRLILKWTRKILTAKSRDPTLTWTGFSTYWLAMRLTADGHVALGDNEKDHNVIIW